MGKPEINIFIHRRDFRTQDNTALNKLVELYPGIPVMHVFIFNPVQIEKNQNAFYNSNCIQFMIESLKSFRDELGGALYFFHGSDIEVLGKLIAGYRVNAVAWNLDYTPFARKRDEYLRNWCAAKKIECFEAEDYSLFDMGAVLNGSGKMYGVYTPFYNKCLKMAGMIRASKTIECKVFKEGKSGVKNLDVYFTENPNLQVRGGRGAALKILNEVKKGTFKNYDYARNYPAMDKTTKLAAYIKFGCISIREAYEAFKAAYGLRHGLVRELIWREFYAHASWHFPGVFSGEPFKENKMKWVWKKEWYDRVMAGMTGFPFIDAAIRDLKTTGWMNNRLRMVVASFITKDLCMDWRIFERDLFGRYLVDYDPSSNCHSWQGIAGVGIDAPPYWRVMNPWLQTEKFDPGFKYIKKWIPELAGRDDIGKWRLSAGIMNYPAPMVDHEKQVKWYLERWRKFN